MVSVFVRVVEKDAAYKIDEPWAEVLWVGGAHLTIALLVRVVIETHVLRPSESCFSVYSELHVTMA
eukprot:266199-Amphidinium_carterae.1